MCDCACACAYVFVVLACGLESCSLAPTPSCARYTPLLWLVPVPLPVAEGRFCCASGWSRVCANDACACAGFCCLYIWFVLVGGPGQLVNQALVGSHALAASEGLLLAERLGIDDTPALLTLLGRSYGNSTILQRCGKLLVEGTPKDLATSGAALRNLAKVLRPGRLSFFVCVVALFSLQLCCALTSSLVFTPLSTHTPPPLSQGLAHHPRGVGAW